VTRYYNDGFDVLFETDGTGSLTRSYTHGARIDEILSSSDSKARLSDGLGSTRTLTDAAGQQTASYIYDVFGAIRSEVGTSENAYLFTGRELDSETGLYYYRNRYYNPAVGRFVTKDPIGMGGGINKYTYVKNSPVKFIDPYGEDAQFVIFVVSLALAVKGAYELYKFYKKFESVSDQICSTGTLLPEGSFKKGQDELEDLYNNTPTKRLNRELRSKEFKEFAEEAAEVAVSSYGN